MSIITISRGTFSGGQVLAERLSERLGYRCVSREEVLESATRSYGVPVEKLAAAMDKPPSFWERLIGERSDYINYIRAALCEYARAGDLIYHGYVGHMILAGISHVIRVRIIADMDSRINVAMERHNLSREEAIARIKKIDRERVLWTRFLHGVEWEDPSQYDVVLNLRRMGIAGASDIVASMTELEAFKPTEESSRAMENLALSSRVWAVLATDIRTADADLKVAAHDGVVTITGTTHSQAVEEAIPSVALRVEGVTAVRSDVVQVPPVVYEPI